MRMAAFGVLDSLAAAAAVGVLAASAAVAQIQDTRTSNPRDLRPLASFSGISDQAERSRALFNEIAKVVTHPRCMNCHPAGNHPLQGDDRHEHLPPVPRGDAGLGVAGLNCATCHTERNFTLVGAATYKSIPGHPRWQLAPIEMAWEGKSVSQTASSSRIRRATAGARSRSCTSISPRTIWSRGAGRRAKAASPRRAASSSSASLRKRGSTAARSARNQYSPLVPAKAGTQSFALDTRLRGYERQGS